MGVGHRRSVAVLMGGTSAEHDVSVNSGLNVLDALLAAGHDARPVYIDREGDWFFDHRPPAPPLERAPGEAADTLTPPVDRPDRPADAIVATLRRRPDQVVFVALHGPGGEDGAIQGLLTHAGVAFTGSGILASALAMDKVRAKQLFDAHGIPVAAHVEMTQADLDGGGAELVATVGLPCVVKPVAGGSSFGTHRVGQSSELEEAIRSALRHDRRVLVEAYLEGREVTCGVLGGGSEPTEALPLTEIRPLGVDFFDFRAKYTASACEEITPAEVPETDSVRVQDLAGTAHRLLGCEGVSRSDFILTERGPVILEVNTIPGFTRTSLLPQGAAAAGIEFERLVERLVESALRRGAGSPNSG